MSKIGGYGKLGGLALLIFGLSGCGGSEPPFKVEAFQKKNPYFNVPYGEVRINATTDEVVIESLKLNRGNCKVQVIYGLTDLPRTIKFGQSLELASVGQCNIQEAEITANGTVWKFSFN
ncbi:hypothetical protein IB259_00235 [Achromobacter sp. ACM04]|uniref:hypothetical protein n=1 Tax=Achromobacter sp. ACM04 TaxID=2769312 RepID=UPI00177DE844|nr:hypothetical protein [Achromobacter sp. ACM04]MBD9417646.1 hypothetical protein [Achromobacter sp. ACM04]